MKNNQRIYLVFCFIALGCSNTKNSTNRLGIEIAPSQNSLLIKNLPPELMESRRADSVTWSQLFSIYADDATDDLQKPLEGTYKPLNTQILFTPRVAFAPGKRYRLEIYLQNRQLNLLQLIRKKQQMNQNQPIIFRFSY